MANSSGNNELWYLRKRGQILGPYDLPQLNRLRDRGQLSRFHELSTNKIIWQKADEMGLFASENQLITNEPAPHAVVPEIPVQPVLPSVSDQVHRKVANRTLSLSLAILTIGFVLEFASWVIIGFTWLLGFLGDNYQLFEIASIMFFGSVIAVNIVLLVGFGIGCGTAQSNLSNAYSITCLVVQIIDIICVLFVIILVVNAGANWRNPVLVEGMGLLIVNALRFLLAVTLTVFLINWLKAIGDWLKNQGHSSVSPTLIQSFFYVYTLQLFFASVITILFFSMSSRQAWRAEDPWTTSKLSVVLGITIIIYAMLQCVTAVWRIIMLKWSWSTVSQLQRQ